MMRSRYRLPGEIGGGYHLKKIDSSDNTKMSRFFNPVIATKNIEKVEEKITCDNREDVERVIIKAFKRVHVSFQST